MTTPKIARTLSTISPDEQHRYTNYQVLAAVQALLGSITSNMIGISLRCVGEEVHLYCYLEQDSELDREEIDDLEDELAALQCTSIPIFSHVTVVGEPWFPITEMEGRPIYFRYVPASQETDSERDT